jgi:hypothetical protein
MRRQLLIMLLVPLITGTAQSATITVMKDGSGDFTVIQAALDVAAAGDTILIGPGEYLEHATVRFPAWTWDIESYANVMVDDLTIIGAGADQTFIGPETYAGSAVNSSPKAITYIEGGDLSVKDVCLRNSRTGFYVYGRLFLDGCVMSDNYINLWWEAVGSGGWIRNCQFDVWTPSSPISIDIVNRGGASDILVENCTVRRSLTLIDGVQGITFRGCEMSGAPGAMDIYGSAHVFVDDCLIDDKRFGIGLALGNGALCEITDSRVLSAEVALMTEQPGGRFVVSESTLEGRTFAVLYATLGPGACQITNSDLLRTSGHFVRCGLGGSPVTHDLRNNYWGTTDEATIRSWILDHEDDPAIAATVLYSPFAGQSVPTEATSWGELKALFR